ncbi:MAG: response regulator [Chitinophagaceae bacterium]|nr:response regulator [Chitinophagaceae bacterium]
MVYFFVDDDADDQEIFGLAIAELDGTATCRFANDGLEALEALQDESFTPSLIFIDLNMPRMNGNECLAELKKLERLSKVPIFIYSTSSDPKLIAASKALGADDFIVKPSGFQALTEILKKLTQ